jgi:hypothetical protein
MKKIKQFTCIAAIAVVLGISQNAQAQLQKGNLMIGTGIANLNFGFQKGANVHFELNPQVGYFIKDNIVVGGLLNLGVDYQKSRGTNVTYGLNAFGRYYISDPTMVLLNHARFFGEASAGINGSNTKAEGKDAITTNGFGIGIGPGIAYFITPNISLEALAKYNLIIGGGTATTSNKISIGIGFQIYLPTSKARAVYNEAASEVKGRE